MIIYFSTIDLALTLPIIYSLATYIFGIVVSRLYWVIDAME